MREGPSGLSEPLVMLTNSVSGDVIVVMVQTPAASKRSPANVMAFARRMNPKPSERKE